MSKYLIDTNIVIYLLKGEPSVTDFFEFILKDETNKLLFSVITIAEIFSRPVTAPIKAAVNELLAIGSIVEMNQHLAYQAGVLRAQMYNAGKKVPKLPDAIIAATAITMDAILVTHNLKDFSYLSDTQLHDPLAQ